jgi:uncharacterized protein
MKASHRAIAEVVGVVSVLLAVVFGRHVGVSLRVPGGVPPLAVGLALAGVLIGGARGRGVFRDLGLTRPPTRGLLLATLGTLPMAAGLALPEFGTTLGDHYDTARTLLGPMGIPRLLPALLHGALLAALGEELLLRGYAVRRLAAAGVHMRIALLLPGVLFGLGHLPGALDSGLMGAGMTVALTTAGGVWFGWLYARWGWSVWVPMAAHFSMNAWWVAGSVGPTAASGGFAANAGRVLSIALITWGTLRWTPAISPPEDRA